jgi:signal transduction histidine kinase
MLWRLPLVLFFLIAGISLWNLDGRLVSDHRAGAVGQAAQMAALVEGAIGERATSLRALKVAVTSIPAGLGRERLFRTLADEIMDGTPDMMAAYRLDAAGTVELEHPPGVESGGLLAQNHLLLAPLADAIVRAQRTRETAVSGLVPLRPDTLGVVVYEPVMERGRVTGFVAGAIVHGALLRQSLRPEQHGRFAYRLVDESGTALGISPDYPARVTTTIDREISLPGGRAWRLEIALRPFQPVLARVTLWVVGLLLLGLVCLLVVREDARADRLAMHSFNLELLSRNLLDANVKLEERAQQVTEANRAKSRFLANVSHELRTPLNAVVGYNSLAMSGVYGDVPTPLRAVHERIGAAANHLLGLVNDVLDLSKIEVGRMDIDPRPIVIERLLEDVVAVIEPVADAKGVRVDLVVPRGVPTVISDAVHVRQILMNLTSNAIKFTERGAITIVARRSSGEEEKEGEDGVEVLVEDTGIGIPADHLDRIFDEFEQIRPGGRGDSLTRGAGLGLPIARKLARLLGGDVTAESRVGTGSRFTLRLPKLPPMLTGTRESDAAETTAGGSGGEGGDGPPPRGTGSSTPPPRDGEQGSTVHGLDDTGIAR